MTSSSGHLVSVLIKPFFIANDEEENEAGVLVSGKHFQPGLGKARRLPYSL